MLLLMDLHSHREIKAQYLFEKETAALKYPQYQDGSFMSGFKLGFYDYLSLLTSRSKLYAPTHFSSDTHSACSAFVPNRRRLIVSPTTIIVRTISHSLLDRTMFFQQWTGVNAILYYAPAIFQSLGLTGSTISLLATGVVGIV